MDQHCNFHTMNRGQLLWGTHFKNPDWRLYQEAKTVHLCAWELCAWKTVSGEHCLLALDPSNTTDRQLLTPPFKRRSMVSMLLEPLYSQTQGKEECVFFLLVAESLMRSDGWTLVPSWVELDQVSTAFPGEILNLRYELPFFFVEKMVVLRVYKRSLLVRV